jgi:hypothetical protein
MDWRKIMSDAGIPESPGRDEAIQRMSEPRPYRATFREKKSGLMRTERVMALNFKDALRQVKRDGATVISILEDW